MCLWFNTRWCFVKSVVSYTKLRTLRKDRSVIILCSLQNIWWYILKDCYVVLNMHQYNNMNYMSFYSKIVWSLHHPFMRHMIFERFFTYRWHFRHLTNTLASRNYMHHVEEPFLVKLWEPCEFWSPMIKVTAPDIWQP